MIKIKQNNIAFTIFEALVALNLLLIIIFSLSYLQLHIRQLAKKDFYFNLALQQLQNGKSIILAINNHEIKPQKYNLNNWNQDNANLLPKGHGIFKQQYLYLWWYSINDKWLCTNLKKKQNFSCLSLKL